MTVQQIVNRLQQFPPSAECVVMISGGPLDIQSIEQAPAKDKNGNPVTAVVLKAKSVE